MTPSSVERVRFGASEVAAWAREDPRRSNWPVVYVIDGDHRGSAPAVYVGETVNAVARMHQHLGSQQKRDAGLRSVRVIIGDRFNKSVCLDLESHLIRWLAGDGRFTVLNETVYPED